MNGKIIEFVRTKDYKFIKEIGQGGTGRTVLLEDEIINERFVCKKYSPYYEEHRQLFFNNFKEEIKLLHQIYHQNIVRVFNYYLYPEQYTGYILMEYVKGKNISKFVIDNPDRLNNIFGQTISGFCHLEKNKILHRDIRPHNILVSNEGVVKIIDFGFSKKVDFENDYKKSISLNWRYNPPMDFTKKIYNFKTEVYFVAKLFEEIIFENNFENFAYNDILKQMLIPDYDERINSFFEVERAIVADEYQGLTFTEEEKGIYIRFASSLSEIYSKIDVESKYNTDIDKIISGLDEVYRNSMLETFVQNHNSIAKCFVKGDYRYYTKRDVEVSVIKDFVNLLKSISIEKRKVVMNNLWQRLDSIEREAKVPDDDLPF
ncbi:protein kinase family protein [uncultured Draconibacterium sp.]|uniref:protein kinase family protein n=1 Tax=uncultured Draconibacterium sp. TaxID=1573823 RepID=UPI0029C95AB1|nr:protein kinase family protein [uncultured Draconibacterium sp.]